VKSKQGFLLILPLKQVLGGLGVGGTLPCVIALTAELSNRFTSSRGRRVTLLSVSWSVGAVFTALLAWLILDPEDNSPTWQGFFLLCSLPAWAAIGMVQKFVIEPKP
jgi:MFS family permease